MPDMTNFRCPICKKKIKKTTKEPLEKFRFFPFCSQRCKLIDLGVWFDGNYKIITDLKSQQEQQNPQIDTTKK